MFLAKIRKAARELLTLDEKDARRLFQGVCVSVWSLGVCVGKIISYSAFFIYACVRNSYLFT